MSKAVFFVLILSSFFGFAQYTLIPDLNFEKELIRLTFDTGIPDGKVLTADISGVTSLNLQFLNISDMTGIEGFTSLTYLTTSIGNQFTTIDLSKNIQLKDLICSQNKLQTLNLEKNINLTHLDCRDNEIIALDLSKNINLISIYCQSNKLNTLNLKNGKEMSLNSSSNSDLSCILVDNVAYYNASYTVTKDPSSRFSTTCDPIVPPIITATGNQVYCANTNIKVATEITITHDPSEQGADAVSIQISSGYINGLDKLLLANPSSHSKIEAQWNFSEGKLKLFSPTGAKVPYADFVNAIKDVEYSNSSSSPSGTRNFSINLGIGQANYLPSNGHFYEFVPNVGVTWTDAKTLASTRTYYGLQGYLATLTTEDEAQLAGAQAPGAGWIGGTDAANEGVWKWVTGPEGLANGGTGTIFWNGDFNGSSPTFAFWNTNSNYSEPNNAGGNEHYAHITNPNLAGSVKGGWNDMANTGGPGLYVPQGYIVEYGGMPGELPLQISASTTITIPRIESTIQGEVCNSGSVTLKATASNGNVYWYNTKTGASFISIGDSYTTPILTSTTSYYVDATNNNCVSTPRTEVIATVKTPPTITSITGGSVCDSGTVTLEAVASSGTIYWFDVSTGGTALATGTTFTTPNISVTKTYYVEATANGCTSLSRTAVTATVNSAPLIAATTPGARCDSGSVILDATPSAGNVNWYDVASGGTKLFTGNSFSTPNINKTTSYYAEAILNDCTSSRVPVVATVYPISTATEEIVLCQDETTTLDASIPNMIYLWSPGGETTQTIEIEAIGNYSVTISSPTVVSCDSKKNITVTEHPQPIVNSIVVNGNSITVELENPKSYFEYSINGIDFQASNQFSYIPTGQHTAFVREKNGCNLVTQQFTIFTIPEFFTPNDDGFNDEWKIIELIDYPTSSAQIYDRYGKLIKELSATNYSWDGKHNSRVLPADDYWYVLKLDNTKPEIRGHFTLKR